MSRFDHESLIDLSIFGRVIAIRIEGKSFFYPYRTWKDLSSQ